MSHDRNAQAADIASQQRSAQVQGAAARDVHAPDVQAPDVQAPDVPVEVRLAQLLLDVRSDAQIQPETYARDTEVPDGGE